MSIRAGTLTLACLASASIILFTIRADADQYGDKVNVWFAPDVIALPPDSSSALLSSIQIDPSDLTSLLSSYQVARMGRTFPSAVAEDTLRVASTGETVHIPDFSRVYTLTVSEDRDIDSLIAALYQRPEVLLAERSGYPVFQAAFPNDSLFARGDQYSLDNFGQSGGTSGADIKAAQAWSLCTGDSTIFVGIADNGVTSNHPDLSGRVIDWSHGNWDSTSTEKGHAFKVAGIIAANANNALGIAGVDWHTRLISYNISNNAGITDTTSAMNGIYTLLKGAPSVINNSYLIRDRAGAPVNSLIFEAALLTARANSCSIVAGMGNDSLTHTIEYPAAYPHVIAVGATDRMGNRWTRSEQGSHIDVVAPGVAITSSYPFGSQYTTEDGTSFSTPMVTGVAALMYARSKALGRKLYPEDVEHLIALSADDIAPQGFDVGTGYGQVNARRALEFLTRPHILKRGTVQTGAFIVPGSAVTGRTILVVGGGINGGRRTQITRYTVQQHIDFAADTTGGSFQNANNISVWARTVDSGGFYPASDTLFFDGGHDFAVVPNTLTTSGCEVQSYIYYDPSSGFYWGSESPFMHSAWTAFERRPSSVPDTTQSFFVPQADSTGGIVLEGLSAMRYFRTCPNNDGAASYPKGARVQVTVRDSNGIGIPGIAAADIYILLNGGTSAQGFNNAGADSILARARYDTTCVDLRTIYADGPTDANGVTRITFSGVPDAQNNRVRDPARKWGHYDSDMPIYVLGRHIRGKLTSGAALGTYSLEIKNFDLTGLGTNFSEVVNISDLNSVVHWLQVPYSADTHWAADFDSDGAVDITDFEVVQQHMLHCCNYPNVH